MENITQAPVGKKKLTLRQKITMVFLTTCVVFVVLLNIVNLILAI
tara:strand:+ start:147726 stop:147860 length:135 start_codon:yes stop_codon:yes gene_type:complete